MRNDLVAFLRERLKEEEARAAAAGDTLNAAAWRLDVAVRQLRIEVIGVLRLTPFLQKEATRYADHSAYLEEWRP